MFFRFYILGTLGTIFFLFTSVWAVSFVMFMWFLLILVKAPFNYKKFKRERVICYPRTLSFCIKSMKRQKQNFKIISFLIRNESIQKPLKKLSILMDDINVKSTSHFDNSISSSHSDHQSPFVYSHSYSDCPENLYH